MTDDDFEDIETYNAEANNARAARIAAYLAEMAGADAPEGFYYDENGKLQPIEVGPDYRYVLGLDPGGTTGVAMLRYTDETAPELIYLHQIEGGEEGYYQYFHGSVIGSNLDVASEKFVPFEGVYGADLTPIYIEGQQFAQWHDQLDALHYQEPSMKSLVPDDWLREQNLWTEGKRHQMDALIHALVWLRNNDHKPTLKAMSGETDEKLAEEGEAESKQLPPQGGGEGEGDEAEGGESQTFEEAMEAISQAFKQMGEAAQAAQEAMQEAAQGAGEEQGQAGDGQPQGHGDGTPAGGVRGEIQQPEGEGHHRSEVEVTGTRKRRERNGVFAGFETDDEGIETELYSD